ncbi:hypothetical protein Zmor_007549 [Zophobas morio]|uniref:Reverse transcriptase domain-containing protein n=1 Tax=Zophobas morio TaxID=2755281 RepID=A0AA38MM70_9CUCU|nr:hypothetical protein Zmor_007549 [Zophobas morio]
MESIIYETLIKFLLDQHIIPEEQRGFLSGKSTISNFLSLSIEFPKAFFSDRTFRVRVGDALSEHIPILSGVPQGSILGPVLFITYTAELKDIIQSRFAMYADDIKLYNTSNNQSILKNDLSAMFGSIYW